MTRHNRTSQAAEHRREAAYRAPDTPDVRDTDWYRYVEYLDQLLTEPDLEWAAPTLRSIQEQIQETREISERQREAVAHIVTGRVLSWRVWRVRSSP
jgi:hypothetical protein